MIWFGESIYSKDHLKYIHYLENNCVAKDKANIVVINTLVYGDNVVADVYFYMAKKEFENLPPKKRTNIIETQIIPAYCRTFETFKNSKRLEVHGSYAKDYYWLTENYYEIH